MNPEQLERLRRSIDEYRAANDSTKLAYALRDLGEAQRSLSDSDGGVAAYEESVALLRREHLPQKLAHTVRHLGDIYRHRGDSERARQCYEEALAIYRNDPHTRPLDLANTLRGFAKLLWSEAKRIYDAEGIDTSRERNVFD